MCVDLCRRRILERGNFGLPIAAQHDIRAATRHVRGNRDHTRSARLRDDFGFAFVLFRIQHTVRNFASREFSREAFGRFDRRRAHQYRTPLCNASIDVLDDRVVFLIDRQIHEIVRIFAHHWPVRRNHDHFEAIDLMELERFGLGGAGHAGRACGTYGSSSGT